MRVRVLLFGVLKDIFERSEESLDLGAGATVADVLNHYRELAPELAKFFPSLALALNQRYASPAETLSAGDEIALLPPVSGGSGTATETGQSRCEIVRSRIPTDEIVEGMKQGEDGAV